MVYNNVILKVINENDVAEVKSLLKEQALRSSSEPGCERFGVYHSQVDTRQFLLVEIWETQKDLERHKEAKAFTELCVPKVIPLVSREPHLSDLVWP
ncbi:MAG: antibiotic biosynthesis monooxygenase family protein [Pseudomonadota bacterium]|nr:antibiotic biosynthesis monooxygenase family protein [Pseudomonadota bacterium]